MELKPLIKRNNRDKKREIRHLMYGESCKKSVGEIYKGMEIFGLTFGQFSIINIIEEILNQTGAANVNISTWTAANAEIKKAENFLYNKKIKTLRFLFDRGFPTRQPKYFEIMKSLFGENSFRLTRSHCKFVTIVNEKWNISIRTSMNLNENKRIENFEISDCAELTNYLVSIVDGFFEKKLDMKGAPVVGIKQNKNEDLVFPNVDELDFKDF